MTLFKRKLHRIAFAGVLTLAACTVAAPAQAQGQYARPNGYPVTNVNLRAGPGTYYPVVLVVPTHAPISILACLGDYTWCDVMFQGNRGWMRSIYLQKWYQGYYYGLDEYAPRLGISVVAFNIGSYWDSYYRDRPFYADRARWGASFGEGWTDRGAFYGRLAPYGNWIWLQGQYVWVPRNVGPYWRPYTVGRWIFTDRYGWMWVSNEPFGWATYHYGRWGFSNRVGWFWVPGNRWAPAWVSWRQSNDYLAWAPLPPTADEGFGLSIRVGTIPDYYWQAVPAQSFLSVDLSGVIIRDRNRFRPILQETQPIGNVTVVNNTTIVNNVVNLTYVEQKTKKKVVAHKVERTKNEKQAGKVEGAAIEVFQPTAEEVPATAAPPAAKPIEEVAAQSETKQQVEDAPSTEDLLVPEEIKKLPGKKGKGKKGATESGDAAAPPPPPAPSAATETMEEAAPPPPPPPPPAEEEGPAPAPAIEAPPPPPPAEEAAPASPPPVDEPAPKPHKENGQKKQEKSKPVETQAAPPPPPPVGEQAPPPPPPPSEEAAPPPPAPVGEEALKPKKQGKPKQEKEETGNQGQPGGPPPSFQPEPLGEAPPPPPPSAGAPPKMKKEGNQGGKQKKGKGAPSGEACPEGTVPLEDGTCVPAE